MRRLACAAALWLTFGWANPALAFSGVVTYVTDGDTLWVRPEGGAAIKVRLQGIDAPERCQAWGPQAREALANRVLQRRVKVFTRARDDHRRTIGRVEIEGHDVAEWLVRQGHAWSQRYRRSPGPYATQEADARRQRLGLFAAPAVEPREFRKVHGPCGR